LKGRPFEATAILSKKKKLGGPDFVVVNDNRGGEKFVSWAGWVTARADFKMAGDDASNL